MRTSPTSGTAEIAAPSNSDGRWTERAQAARHHRRQRHRRDHGRDRRDRRRDRARGRPQRHQLPRVHARRRCPRRSPGTPAPAARDTAAARGSGVSRARRARPPTADRWPAPAAATPAWRAAARSWRIARAGRQMPTTSATSDDPAAARSPSRRARTRPGRSMAAISASSSSAAPSSADAVAGGLERGPQHQTPAHGRQEAADRVARWVRVARPAPCPGGGGGAPGCPRVHGLDHVHSAAMLASRPALPRSAVAVRVIFRPR